MGRSVAGDVAGPEIIRWTLIVVTHNSSDDLRRYWCRHQLPPWVRVIVVDSDSDDGSFELGASFADDAIKVENRGLSAANNEGLVLATSRYVGFCNPDVQVDCFTLLALEQEIEEGGGLVAPRLKGEDGELQPNGRAWPTLRRQLGRKIRPNSAAALEYLWPKRVDWITGAFVCCKREEIVRMGGWSDQYFLYFEDVDLCLRAYRHGYPVRIIETAIATHAWRRDSSRKIFSFGVRIHAASMLRFYWSNPSLLLGMGLVRVSGEMRFKVSDVRK